MPRRFVQLLLVVAACGVAERGARGQQQQQPPWDNAAQLMLIRNTLTLVNHGNLTGNYTVLRDLASENFRRRNTAADLAATFANLRQQKLDLSPILVIDPLLAQPPAELAPGRWQLVGSFPTRPQAVQFALVFVRVEAGWMIDEVSLRVAPAETRPPPVRQPAAAAGFGPPPDYRRTDTVPASNPQPTRFR
jgi:hypothetical protein